MMRCQWVGPERMEEFTATVSFLFSSSYFRNMGYLLVCLGNLNYYLLAKFIGSLWYYVTLMCFDGHTVGRRCFHS